MVSLGYMEPVRMCIQCYAGDDDYNDDRGDDVMMMTTAMMRVVAASGGENGRVCVRIQSCVSA